jgi:hypothetical protein
VRACHYHEDRPAVGICMRCRRAICAACTTRLDGVNHCHQCLKKLSHAAVEPRGAAGFGVSVAVIVLLLGSFFLFLELLLMEGWLAS